jgi:hypothetical protein
MSTTTDVRTTLVIDKGPVWDAARILVESSTLTDHVNISEQNEWTATVEHRTDDVPFDLWGSGTQALWRLLSAMVYTAEQVSLYEVASRCDTRNSQAAALAVYTLFGGEASR